MGHFADCLLDFRVFNPVNCGPLSCVAPDACDMMRACEK